MLRVMAVSAPHWVSKGTANDTYSLNSQTPFSLQNALRDAVDNARNGIGAWGDSNFSAWSTRNEAMMLMQYWEEEQDHFKHLFNKIDPNILFIGAMTLSLPGAIEIAKYAKHRKGDKIFIVLGGKHCNETMYKFKNSYVHHPGSPLKLISEHSIPNVFDLVCSGDGEKIVTTIGTIVYQLLERNLPFSEFSRYAKQLEESEGDWLAGQYLNNTTRYYESTGKPIDYTILPHALDQFAFGKGFAVFNSDFTVHTYSEMSMGCAYNCFFCSEKSYINGKLRIKSDISVRRLVQQFKRIRDLKLAYYQTKTISAFVEDSIFLGGKPEFIRLFAQHLLENEIHMPFGCQFTIDTFLSPEVQKTITALKAVGLEYVAFGIETSDENIAKTFSKNTDSKKGWAQKTESVLRLCKQWHLKCGMFLLWGLGETQESRMNHLSQINEWMDKYQTPIEVGLNIATKHPLRSTSSKNEFNYIEWGTSKNSAYLDYFVKLFGEASEKYRFSDQFFPSTLQLQELSSLYMHIKSKANSM